MHDDLPTIGARDDLDVPAALLAWENHSRPRFRCLALRAGSPLRDCFTRVGGGSGRRGRFRACCCNLEAIVLVHFARALTLLTLDCAVTAAEVA
jgi:hypothetical protein